MRRIMYMLLIAVVCILGIYFWVQNEGDNNGPIVFLPKTIDASIEFWQVVDQGMYAAAAEYGTTVKVMGTVKETDYEGQIALLKQAMALKPQAILLSASDYEKLVPAAKDVVKAGIPLITVDSGLEGGISDSLIATDNFEAGKKAGNALAEALPNRGKVAILNYIQGTSTSIDRENGVRDSLNKVERFQIVGTFYSDGLSAKAYTVTESLLRQYPDLQGIVCLNEPTTLGAAEAVRDAAKYPQVKLIGFDSSMNEISMLEDGIIQAIVVQKPFNMGYLAVKTAVQLKRGKHVEPRIDTGSQVIWKKTMYDKENQKLLFPFLDQKR
ncbi:substrate-binding domain-containing protein [Paenibacillus albus]|uniref:LacI family transcriptional regulator n=1 Tax=Paenibacillus albus TaxID=2495582 RepID=A0A3Q8X8Z0_9BACL|nr:substrate-binding domain-containing protein [Paenibacillus albus]AZN42879.1 LacI family transcriptional regulator [Paenibacillus albus]